MSIDFSPFGIRPDQRVIVLIDGPSLYYTSKALNFEVNFKKFLRHFDEESDLQRVYYFTAVDDSHDGDRSGDRNDGAQAPFMPVRRLVDWLSFNGYKTVTKPFRDFVDGVGRRRSKSNVTVEIAVELMRAAKHPTHVVLFSGEGDLAYAVQAAQIEGAKVTVVSSLQIGHQAVAEELRRSADRFVELATVQDLIYRDRNEPDDDENDAGTPSAPSRTMAAAPVVEHRTLSGGARSR